MDRYLKLRNILLGTLPPDHQNVYFQAPKDGSLLYPCIKYTLDGIAPQHANNNPYIIKKSYSITIIDKDPSSGIVDKVALLSSAKFNTKYEAESLNHFVFTLYF